MLGVSVNVFFVSVEKVHLRSGTSLTGYVESVSSVPEKTYATRGTIYEAGGKVVANDVLTYDIICFMDPNRKGIGDSIEYVDDINKTAMLLAPILDTDEDTIRDYLNNANGLYQTELGPAGKNLSQEQKDRIDELELNGIGFRVSHKRNYPYGERFSPQLLGFAKPDDEGKLVGQLGLESYLNDELSGKDGIHSYQTDKYGYTLPGMYDENIPAENGYDVYLTLDASIQDALMESIEQTVEFKNGTRVWAAVAEIDTGKILAWGQYPSYNPNDVKSEDTQVNFGAQLSYEAGSVMKPIIYSAAIELGTYDSDNYFDSNPYCYTDGAKRVYDGYSYGCIHNVSDRVWGWIPLDYGLIYSSNVATATLLADYVGIENYGEFIKKYHLYEKVNTDGIDEVTGYTNYGYSPADCITATYGQGSSTTMLQILQAYSAMFGNGEEIKPYFIDKIVDPNTDKVLYQGGRKVVSNPISASTAKQLQDILRRVVTDPEGTCSHYASKNIDIIGKTGTSEIAVNGEYEMSENINSVMLAFPYEKPKYMIYYAYVSSETVYFNYDKRPIPDLVDKVALLTNLTGNIDMQEKNDDIKLSTMPSILTDKLDTALEKLADTGCETVVIGDGEYVVAQAPFKGEQVPSINKIFILTNGENIIAPDFTGWTRKDIIDYWNLTKVGIVINGYGTVYEQSIPPGEKISEDIDIVLTLHTPDEFASLENSEEQQEEITEETDEEEQEEADD